MFDIIPFGNDGLIYRSFASLPMPSYHILVYNSKTFVHGCFSVYVHMILHMLYLIMGGASHIFLIIPIQCCLEIDGMCNIRNFTALPVAG